MGGRNPVRSLSATTMSSSASKGSLPVALRDVAHRTSFVGGVLGGEGLVDDQVLPPGQRADDAGFLGLRPRVQPGPLGRVGENLHALGNGQGEHLTPPRQAVEDGAGLEAEPQLHGVGQGERHHGGAAPGGRRRRVQLMLEAARVEGGDPEDVPVGGTIGQERQRRHEVDLVLAEPVETPGHDELEGRPGMRRQDRGTALRARSAMRRETAPACRRRRCGSGPGRSRSRARLPRASGPTPMPWPAPGRRWRRHRRRPRPSRHDAPPSGRRGTRR